MSKFERQFIAKFPKQQVFAAFSKVIPQSGFGIKESTESGIKCVELSPSAWTWGTKIDIQLSDHSKGTFVKLKGSVFGLGPLQKDFVKNNVHMLEHNLKAYLTGQKKFLADQISSNNNALEKIKLNPQEVQQTSLQNSQPKSVRVELMESELELNNLIDYRDSLLLEKSEVERGRTWDYVVLLIVLFLTPVGLGLILILISLLSLSGKRGRINNIEKELVRTAQIIRHHREYQTNVKIWLTENS